MALNKKMNIRAGKMFFLLIMAVHIKLIDGRNINYY